MTDDEHNEGEEFQNMFENSAKEAEDFLAYANRKMKASSAKNAAAFEEIGRKARRWDLEGRALERRRVEALEALLEPDKSLADPDKLSFAKEDLERFVAHRKEGLAAKSLDWIDRASLALWEWTKGEVSSRTLTALREHVLAKYKSADSHSKILNFAASFLKFLAKTKMEPRYSSFEAYLEMPKAVKERKSITSRIVTKGDIENVLRHIKRAEKDGTINAQRSAQYSAFVIFGAFTGQRSMATMANLTVGQFREALRSEKPVLHVESSQDKIRMEHYVPLHAQVVSAIEAILGDRKDEDRIFGYNSFQMWMKRHPVPMSRFEGHFELSDLRKFAEQHGDIIEWEQSNRKYVLTHGVSGVEWSHYKNPLPDSVYAVYMKYWRDVWFKI